MEVDVVLCGVVDDDEKVYVKYYCENCVCFFVEEKVGDSGCLFVECC